MIHLSGVYTITKNLGYKYGHVKVNIHYNIQFFDDWSRFPKSIKITLGSDANRLFNYIRNKYKEAIRLP